MTLEQNLIGIAVIFFICFVVTLILLSQSTTLHREDWEKADLEKSKMDIKIANYFKEEHRKAKSISEEMEFPPE